MAVSVPTSEPTSFVAGDTVSWTTTSSSFPAGSGYALAYALIGPAINPTATPTLLAQGANGVTIVGDGTTLKYTVTIPASTTATIAPGSYTLSRYFTIGGLRYTESDWTGANPLGGVASRPLYVNADPTQAVAATHASRTLAAIEAAIESIGSNRFASVSLDGVSYTRASLGDLYTQRSRYRAEVLREQEIARGGRGLPTITRVVPNFTRNR